MAVAIGATKATMSLTNTVSLRTHARNSQRPRTLCGVGAGVVWILAALSMGCTAELRNLSGVAPYSGMIDGSYRIMGDVDASGVKKYYSDEQAEYIMLHPRSSGVAGPEIAFTRPLPRGQTFRIVSAWIEDTAIDDTIYYVVELGENLFPPGVPVEIRLSLNGSRDGELNPQYYERVK